MSAVSIDTIAKLLDMTPRYVQQLAKEGIIPKPIARGQYEIIPCVVAYIKYLKTSLNGEAGDWAAERGRLTRIQADRQELKLAKLKGDLISLKQVNQEWSELLVSFRDRPLVLPSVLAPSIVNRTETEAERILTNRISAALEKLSNWTPSNDDEDTQARPAPDSRAAIADGEPMG